VHLPFPGVIFSGVAKRGEGKKEYGLVKLLDHGCGTAFRPTYDSPTLPFISSAGR